MENISQAELEALARRLCERNSTTYHPELFEIASKTRGMTTEEQLAPIIEEYCVAQERLRQER
ncbi:MAG TPA: hypothetical protein VGN34_26860 [Ktedonobacteraceae bacterium]|jgi:hypothetical protein